MLGISAARTTQCIARRSLQSTAEERARAQRQRIQNAIPYFDPERFAQLLEKEGFSARQSRAVIEALDDVVEER